MKRVMCLILAAATLVVGIAWAANVVVTITWHGPGTPISANPDPVTVNQGDTIEFKLSADSWSGGVCLVQAGPPLNWNIGPLYPGYPGIQTPPINVPPGEYTYTIQCGEALEVYTGTVIVQVPSPTAAMTWGRIKTIYR